MNSGSGKYVVYWYNLDQVVKEDIIPNAADAKDAERQACMKYPVNERPAPVCSATKIE